MNIQSIKAVNQLAGMHFFDKSTMRFFKCKVYPTVYGEKYFITRETNPSGETRFTVREAVDGGKTIVKVGPFFVYRTIQEAREAAKQRVKLDREEVQP